MKREHIVKCELSELKCVQRMRALFITEAHQKHQQKCYFVYERKALGRRDAKIFSKLFFWAFVRFRLVKK